MNDSVGCKIALTAIFVAVIMGGLGFVTGFLTHALLVADMPDEGAAVVVQEANPDAQSAGEAMVPTDVPDLPEPTPLPTIADLPSTSEEDAFALFWEVWHLVERDYYGDLPTDDELTFGAIRGAMNTLDDPNIRQMKPLSEKPVPSTYSVRYALEVNQGTFSALGIEPGDVLILPGD